ncbi:MAG: hypothetical protein JO266_05610 [Acidobacteria bacterium]|nr:hypothetical protein [Acidobacteriota bacterium]
MADKNSLQKPQKTLSNQRKQPKQINEQISHGDVRRDGIANARDRGASLQPAAHEKFTRSRHTRNIFDRSQKQVVLKRHTVPVTIHVDLIVKTRLQEIAQREGVSLSQTGGAFLKKALQGDIDLQYGAMLQPVLEHILRKHLNRTNYRDALHVESLYYSAQTLYLVTNVLKRSGIETDILDEIVLECEKRAKNLLRKSSPTITSLLAALKNRNEENTELDKGNEGED